MIALLDQRTTLKTSRGVAVALVVMSTVTAGGLWLTAEWIAHALFARGFVGGNDRAMWTLIHLTAVGLVTDGLFDQIVGPSGSKDMEPAEAIRGIDRSDGRSLSVRLRITPRPVGQDGSVRREASLQRVLVTVIVYNYYVLTDGVLSE